MSAELIEEARRELRYPLSQWDDPLDLVDRLADALDDALTRITELERERDEALKNRDEWASRMMELASAEQRLAELGEIYESDQRIIAWEAIASHNVFKDCYDAEEALLDAMINRLDQVDKDRW